MAYLIIYSKAISGQRMLLEKPSTRKIFQRVNDDSSSLYGHHESNSLYSKCTDNLSKISKVFEFDRQVFGSRAYERALRGSLSDTVDNLRRQQSRGDQVPEPIKRTSRSYTVANIRRRPVNPEDIRTKEIDRQLKEDGRKLSRECNVLLLGDRDCGQAFIQQMNIAHRKEFTTEELRSYQGELRNNVWKIIKIVAYFFDRHHMEMDEDSRINGEILSLALRCSLNEHARIPMDVAEALHGLWQNDRFLESLEFSNVHVPDSAH